MTDTRKTLSADIIKRFLEGKDYDEFIFKYNSNKSGIYATNRKEYYSEPLTPEEKMILKKYYQESLTSSLRVMADEVEMSVTRFYSTVLRSSKKLIYQNFEALSKSFK